MEAMLVDVIVDPEQEGLPGYVETWTWRSGYIIVKLSRRLRLPDATVLEPSLQLSGQFTKNSDYYRSVRPEILRRFGVEHLDKEKVDSVNGESAKRSLAGVILAMDKRSSRKERFEIWSVLESEGHLFPGNGGMSDTGVLERGPRGTLPMFLSGVEARQDQMVDLVETIWPCRP